MPIGMLLEVGLKLLAPVAVLDGIPEGKVESVGGDLLWCRRAGIGESAAASSRV